MTLSENVSLQLIFGEEAYSHLLNEGWLSCFRNLGGGAPEGGGVEYRRQRVPLSASSPESLDDWTRVKKPAQIPQSAGDHVWGLEVSWRTQKCPLLSGNNRKTSMAREHWAQRVVTVALETHLRFESTALGVATARSSRRLLNTSRNET